MIRIPVHVEQLDLLALTVRPKEDYASKLQKTLDGWPVWVVTCYSRAEDEQIKVSVAAPEPPDISPGQPVHLDRLRAGAYVDRDGRAAFYWQADAAVAA